MIKSARFSLDGTKVVTASDDKSVRVWNSLTGKEELKLTDHSSNVLCAAFSPDGTKGASGGDSRTTLIHNISTKDIEKTITESEKIWGLDFSPDGKRLVVGIGDLFGNIGEAKIYQIEL